MKRYDRTRLFERSDLHVGHRQSLPRCPDGHGRPLVRRGPGQSLRYVPERDPGVQPERHSRCGTPTASESARKLCSSPGRLSYRTRTRPSRSKRSRPRIPRSCPRSSARSCSPSAVRGSRAPALRPCRRTSRSPHNSGRPAQPEPSKQHYAASMQRPGSGISRHTRSVAHSVASHASAADSRKRRGSTGLPRDPSVRHAKAKPSR